MSTFQDLKLPTPILQALEDVGYETPSPIQLASIPHLLAGRDLLGQAQTGTGKTAAFALPLLARLRTDLDAVQILVLTPTRELAIQVAEAFQRYAHHLPEFHTLPLYGGQGYQHQLRQLKRGVHVVVGTPGRVMDHLRRGTLKIDRLQAMVLDEADEMLRMGFIEDVQWILEHTPQERQTALFSATMPKPIRKVAQQHLRQPEEIKIASKTTTASTIHQRYWLVSGLHKLDALTRLLEIEDFDAVLVFVRTKTATVELADKLSARGHASAALNGDIAQNMRERIVEKLKGGDLDIIIATDVAARGLDVQRISHVINYDIPYDVEAYVHRIGRTGRAGRSGEAVLFVSPRERRLLRSIEQTTKHKIEAMQMPSASAVNEQRVARFKQRISDTLASQDMDFFIRLVTEYEQECEVEPLQIAAALACLAQGDEPLLLKEQANPPATVDKISGKYREDGKPEPSSQAIPLKAHPNIPMGRFTLQVGYRHKVKPGHIVGAIANEAGLDSEYIGQIEIYENFSTIDLPDEIPNELLKELRNVRICGQRIQISRMGEGKKKKRQHKSDAPAPRKTPPKSKQKKRASDKAGHKHKKNTGKKSL